MTTEPIILWTFIAETPTAFDFVCSGTETEASTLVKALAENGESYRYVDLFIRWAEISDVQAIADILTDLEISNTMANDH